MYKKNICISKNTIYIFLFSSLILSMLSSPEYISSLVLEKMIFVSSKVIPSILPFVFLCDILLSLDIDLYLTRPFIRPMQKLKRNPYAVGAILMGSISGFPVGAIYTKQLYEKGMISKKEADIILPTSTIPSPAFIICFIGRYILRSEKIGVLLWIFMLIISLSLCIFCLPSYRKTNIDVRRKNTDINLSKQITDSAHKSSVVCLNVTVLLVLFGLISEYMTLCLKKLYVDKYTIASLVSIIELTSGIKCSSDLPLFSLQYIFFCTGFCGLCVYFQIMSVAHKNADSKMYNFIKMLVGLFLSVFAFLLL